MNPALLGATDCPKNKSNRKIELRGKGDMINAAQKKNQQATEGFLATGKN